MNDCRPLVWPYTMFMLFVGSLVSIMFIPGTIDNYRHDNWLVAGLLTLPATVFIVLSPTITQRFFPSRLTG